MYKYFITTDISKSDFILDGSLVKRECDLRE